MAGREISLEDMSEEQRAFILNNHHAGVDPLELILELEQLALDSGFPDVHTFIEYHTQIRN